MLLFQKSKKIAISILLSSLIAVPTFAKSDTKSCQKRVFDIKITEQVSIDEMLNQLSDMCNFSIVTKDTYASEKLKESVQGINIKDLTLREIFSILIAENDLSYSFSNNVLKISSISTKTFKIDYITSAREGSAIIKASVDSSPTEVGGDSDNKKEDHDNIIKTTEKFDFWEKLNDELLAILNNGSEKIVAPKPIINSNAGLVTITGTQTQIKRAEKYIKELERRLKKQVMIDVSIIAVDLRNEYTKGIDWSKFQLGFNTYVGQDASSPLSSFRFGNINRNPVRNSDGTTIYATIPGATNLNSLNHSIGNGFWSIGANLNFNIQGMINFLQTKGKTKVISSPKVMTMNNQQALITVGDNINYRVLEESSNDNSLSGKTSTTYKQYSVFIGILLNLLPEVSDDNKIMLRINPSLSNFKYGEDNVKQVGIREIAPDTLQKKLSTVVQVNDGDTIVLGGLIGQTKGRDNTRVPLLADIPILGNLFKSSKDIVSTTELIFVITPRIVDIDSKKPIKASLRELGYSDSTYEQ